MWSSHSCEHVHSCDSTKNYFKCLEIILQSVTSPEMFQQIFLDTSHLPSGTNAWKIFAKMINLDKPLWRKLLEIEIRNNPELEAIIEAKRIELRESHNVCLKYVFEFTGLDVAKHCVFGFL